MTLRAVAVVLTLVALPHPLYPAVSDASPRSNAPAQPDPQDFKAMSIEELMQIDVTLATRQPEPIRAAAAAIDVVTAEEIRRSGVTTIADAIALADGVHVARFNNGTWAISSRGFNSNSANKLLVMIDGRTEYSPLFSGVFWNTLDYPLNDIDRIEVIRGPGATLWGANAVNGVINIVTRHSRETQGTHVSLASGNEDPALLELRFGSTVGPVAYRVYGKYAHRDAQVFNTGEPSGDARRRGQAGFRLDVTRASGDEWMLKGDVFQSRDDLPDRADGEFANAALQAAWSRPFSPVAHLSVRTYYRREHRAVPQQLTHTIDTLDVDVQHAYSGVPRHGVISGGTARWNRDTTEGGTVAFSPQSRTYPLFSAFIQDEFAAIPDRLFVTAGVKVERNAFSGSEWQPNGRARFHVTPAQIVWAALSRAVRRPTRLDVDVRAFTPTGALAAIGGGSSYEAEDLLGMAGGYRAQLHNALAVDATLFLHRYNDLRSQELPPGGPPIVVGNTLEGRSSGLEFSAAIEPIPSVRLHTSYTRLHVDLTRAPGSRDIGGGATEANDPGHQFGFRTSIDLPGRVEVDTHIRHASQLPNPVVPAYSELNLRVGWRATAGLDLALVGQDLLHDQHAEFGALEPRRVEFQRALRAVATFRF